MITLPQGGSLGASGLFLPNDLGVNTAWDALNPAANGVIPADGTALSSISDLGLNGNTVTQATGTNQIIFKKNIINNQNAFRFSGNQYASIANGTGNSYSGPLSIFVIGMASTMAAALHVISKAPNPTTGGYGVGSVITSGNSDMTIWGVQDIASSTCTWALNTYQVMGWVFKSDNSVDFYKNRTTTQNVAGSAMSASAAALVFGAKTATGTDQWQGDVLAAFIFFRQLAAWEIALMLNYCCIRIGI